MNILCAYDDSEPAKRALDRAADITKMYGADLAVVSVVPVGASAAGRAVGEDPVDTASDHLTDLGAARAFLDGRGQSAKYIEATGHVGDAIVEAADEHKADLIVVGTRDLGGFQRLLGSSVSDTVSHHANCDVLIVR